MGSRIVFIPQTTTPPAAPSGKVALYIDGTPQPKAIDDAGNTYDLKGPQGPQGSQGVQGEQGPEGPQGIQGPAGPAGLNWKGDYNAATAYAIDDAVAYQDSSWFATAAHAANDGIPPTTNGTTPNTGWAVLALEGAQGPQGPQGTQGPQGVQGIQGVKGDTGNTGPQGPAGADGHILNVSDLGSITGSITVDLSSGHVFTATLTGDITLAWSGLPATGTMTDRVLILTQDATGGHTITWPSGTKWPGGLAYTTDAASIETAIGLLVDPSGNTRAFPVEDFS